MIRKTGILTTTERIKSMLSTVFRFEVEGETSHRLSGGVRFGWHWIRSGSNLNDSKTIQKVKSEFSNPSVPSGWRIKTLK